MRQREFTRLPAATAAVGAWLINAWRARAAWAARPRGQATARTAVDRSSAVAGRGCMAPMTCSARR